MRASSPGIDRALRGLRTGNQTTFYLGVALIAYRMWRRSRDRHQLIYRRALKPGETLFIRRSRANQDRLVIDEELAKRLT
jgi:hypothetical protein